MKNASTVNAGNVPAPASPIEFAILGEKIIIRHKGVLITVSLEELDKSMPPGACRGCGCIAIIQPAK